MAAPDLLWQCVKNQSCFIQKRKNFPTMTTEPGNLCGLNKFQYSGIASKQVLGLDTKKLGKTQKKESIILTTRPKRVSRMYRPGSVLVTTGIKKGKKQGPEQLKKIIGSTWNRPELLEMALKKYQKIKQSFKKRKVAKKAA
mmetsp:Transcript_1374/g.1847  ORF Transcript_1374/g.1847 Transcript_1374/m.1847 type:complete len:141 (+) Transcript_1374:62-484(+)|eukprot:CAMPEP_0114670240 /NCGR_PEP_ID=MMETSP0191-20121206/39277_1 /TAXON_ID=126664 /ORGANISM="Sorites sp." /LENGTH=140 /DNA_ID=CAMNT_0001927519 /DNA_START=61 /DNA_END=483 /DNA_ORIENTATION=-